jgi:chromosome segregation protein
MHLKELSINGFKSFAKKSELEFSSSITAIVGPNGSGKSNIAESFRFVLGEQSVKSMRGKRGEDLIWGGSEKVSRGNRAAVEVVFDNSQRSFALDFDEVRIERIVHRDGQNEYKINGSAVRLKDVHELLAGANIGSTGHHIISQGEADRVLAAGPKERREMIEDALGLKVYQLKKQETERKLEKTLENITQVESLRREAAPHLKYLKKQVEKAERSLEVQAQLKTSYAEYLKREDTYLAHHSDRLKAERVTPVAELQQVTSRLAELETQQTNVSTEVNPALETAESTLRQVSADRQQAERELSRIEGQIGYLERRIADTEKPDETAVLIPKIEIEKLVAAIAISADKALSRGGEANLERALNDLVHKLKSFITKDDRQAVDLTAQDKRELAALRTSVATAESAVQAARAEEERARATVDELRTQEREASEAEREAERERFALENTKRDLEQEVRRIDTELSVLERDRTDFKQQLQEAVTLIGRGASQYFTHEILGADGAPIALADITNEERSLQRERQRELEKLKIRLEELGVGSTEELLKEYEEAKSRDEFLATELTDLHQSVENLRQLINEMDEKLHTQFRSGVDRIAKEFNAFFSLMFGGGAAGLKMVELKQRTDDEGEETGPKTEGVELEVTLPNKRVKGLEMLSGGERALTSIALIFAMSQVNPPPFIILDETDAALDEANSRRYGDMIEALAKKSQLVLITHNRETMSRAGILYGITMGGDGVSKILSVKFDEAAAVAK